MNLAPIVFWVCLLTLVIYFLGSLSLSVKIVGIRTQKMAATYSVYNIFFVLIRIANTLQAPMLSKTVETSILTGEKPQIEVFYLVILMSAIGSIVGALFIPTVHRFMTSAVEKAHIQNSILSIFYKVRPLVVYNHFVKSLKWPHYKNFKRLFNLEKLPIKIISMNMIVSCLQTVSVLSCLYAGYLNPSLRSTCLSLNGFILGGSTLLSLLLTEPHISILADKVAFQGADEGYFRRYLGLVIFARILGTMLSFFLLIPLSHFVVFLAQTIF
jgi:Alternate to MurJ